jgi:SAM-dependent methyltransferase
MGAIRNAGACEPYALRDSLPRVARRVVRSVRRRVFGRDPATYDRVRLGYPARVFEILTERCHLRPGATVFEIGPGTGIATRELLRLGADPLTLIEADRRLARYLEDSLGPHEGRVSTIVAPFEHAVLPAARFDLGVAATSFHWLPERDALRRVARALRPGGWWATWNNHHGDPYRTSALHRALQPLYRELAHGRVGGGSTRASAAKDRRKRLESLRAVGKFDRISREDIRWSVTMNSDRLTALWGTFSDVVTLPSRKRTWFLTELRRIADEQFGGTVSFPMLTPIYTARRL